MTTTRSRVIAAPVGVVWKLASDPGQLPQWWPATHRVESVSRAGWTSVYTTPRGRTVRADFSVATTEPPRRAVWRQNVEGTPFERIFTAVEYELRLAPVEGVSQGGADAATRVELAVEQEPRGWARLGRLQLKGAARRQLDGALAGLAQAIEAPDVPKGRGA